MSDSQMDAPISKQEFIKNFILNAIGFAFITGTVQLVLYPYLSRIMSQADYGVAIMLIGFANLFTAVFGMSLTSVRYRVNTEYKEKKLAGDFNPLFYIGLILNVVFVAVIAMLYKKDISFIDIFLVMLISALSHFRIYFSIHYRLLLNFKKLMIMSLIICAGYLLGIWIANITNVWQMSFIVGELAGAIYVYLTCNTVKEPLKTTLLFKQTANLYLALIILKALSSIPMYADRLLIYPLLSSDEVAIYYVAVFFGKTIGAVITPLAGVLLSYYALKKDMPLKYFVKTTIYILALAVLLVILSMFASGKITGIFYPTIINEAIPYINVANIAIIIFFATTMITPAIIKFCSIKLLLVSRSLSALLYIILSIILIDKFGLMGFCYAMAIANTITLILIVIIGIVSLRKKETAAI